MDCLTKKFEKIEEAHINFINITKDISYKFRNFFNVEEDIEIYFYLGLCNGAGWATKLNNRSVVLLGVEKIVELDWCSYTEIIGLLYHELGHLGHYIIRNESKVCMSSIQEKSLCKLFEEGFAMYCEQKLSAIDNFYHQNKNDWLEWCINNRKYLKFL
jgi:hypothetical protein